MRRTTISLSLAVVLILAGVGAAWAAPADSTTSDAFATWDPLISVGSSTLVRNDAGISATYKTRDLPSDQAITMWFVVFNDPTACVSSPCSVEDLLFNEEAQGDFLIGAGKVIGASGVGNFGGSLKVGDVSGSAFFEIGMPERAVGLRDPRRAEVHLALHSHGPKLSGETLRSQISSFLGGCEVILGDEFGIADSPEAMPSTPGECSTFQVSIHR